mmetsp:Transcript_12426/g.37338  ORF Transcript_12426/g.37338 Transcript_12426/m.37338 type:complete len:507 (+) Transcript_12426:90-1610(+)
MADSTRTQTKDENEGKPRTVMEFLKSNQTRTAFFLFLALLGRAMILITVIPTIILELVNDDDAHATKIAAITQCGQRAIAFCVQPGIGHATDVFGRKPIATITQLCVATAVLFLGFKPPLWILIIVLVGQGAYDGISTVSASMVADWKANAAASRQAHSFGVLYGIAGVSFVFGAGLGGALNEVFGPSVPCFLAAAIHYGSAAYLNFFCGESRPAHVLEEARETGCLDAVDPITPLSLVREIEGVWQLILPFLFGEATMAVFGVWFYILDYNYDWGVVEVTIFITVAGILIAAAQVVGTKHLVPKVFSPAQAVLVASMVQCAAFSAYALAPVGWSIYLILVLTAGVGSIGAPSLRGILTSMAPPEQQGSLQGALQGLSQLTNAFMALVYGGAFSAGTSPFWKEHLGGHFAGLPLLIAAFLHLMQHLSVRGAIAGLKELNLLDADSRERYSMPMPKASSFNGRASNLSSSINGIVNAMRSSKSAPQHEFFSADGGGARNPMRAAAQV